MSNRKIVLIILGCVGGFFAFVGLIIGGVFYATSDMAAAGDNFFAASHKGDYDAAYALMSEDVRRNSGKDALEAFVLHSGFDKVVDTSWSSRSFQNDTGKLEGSVTTETGGVIPVTVQLVKENDAWKITYINRR